MRLTLGLAACLLLVAADSKEKGAKADPLVGTWKIESLVAEGQEREQAKGTEYTFKDGTATAKTPRGERTSTYKVDTSKMPATIDMTAKGGMLDGQTRKGIFEVKGDELKICSAFMPDSERPTKFAADAGSGNILMTLKKQAGGKADKAGKSGGKGD